MACFQVMGSTMQAIKPEPGHVMVDYFDPLARDYECFQTNDISNDSLGETGSISCFENGNTMNSGTAAQASFAPTPTTEPKIKNFHYHPYDPVTHKASKSQLVTTAPPAPKPRKRPSKSRSNSSGASNERTRSASIVSTPECPDSGDESMKTSSLTDRENTAKTQRQSRVKREKESESISCVPKPSDKLEVVSYEQLVAQYMQIHKQQQQLLLQQTAIIQQLQVLEKEGNGNNASLALPQLPSFNLLPQANHPDNSMRLGQCPPPPPPPPQLSQPPQMVRLRLPGEPIHSHQPPMWQPQPTWASMAYSGMGLHTPLPPPPPPVRAMRKPSMITRIRHVGANMAAFVPAPMATPMSMSYPSSFTMSTEAAVNLFSQDLPSSPETGGWSACQSPYQPSSPTFSDTATPTLDLQTNFDLDVLETSPMGSNSSECPPSPLPFINIEALAAKVDDRYDSSMNSEESEVTLGSSCLSDLSF